MNRRNKAFTLIELLVVISIIALLIGILLPALAKARLTAKNVLSAANMSQLNTGSANYAADNRDLIPTYSWRGPRGAEKSVDFTLVDGAVRRARDDQEAASYQNEEILKIATGRWEGTENEIRAFRARLPHRRFNHLVLIDYMSDKMPEEVAASPFDANLLDWQDDPLDYAAGSTVPYAPGNDFNGYEDPGYWRTVNMRQRWAFASTYQTVPAAWNTDGIGGQSTYVPIASTPNLFQGGGDIPLGRRKYLQIAYPSMKVYTFEEFDRFSNREGLYFAYPEAKCNLSFFDGSVRQMNTSDANPGWNPSDPDREWHQMYLPLHNLPLPKNGLGDNRTMCQRYRWTRHGLQGIDFGGKEVGLASTNIDPDNVDCGP